MHHFDSRDVAQALPYLSLIEALAHGLQQPIEMPARSHFEPNHDASCVLVMPAWKSRELMGVKLVSIWPGNHAIGLPSVSGVYVLLSCVNGQPVAVMDGTELTLRRTAAAAALAARTLARRDSTTLAILGTGALSVPLAQAHASAMALEQIQVWGRDLGRAQAVAAQLQALGLVASASADLQATLARADVVAAATTAVEPFIRAAWVQPGTHLGLVGAFTPHMAEAEPALMARPQVQVFADHRAAVLEKGGEVLQAVQQGLMPAAGIEADLAELVVPPMRAWRRDDAAITIFKSVGFASLDLIAAERVYQSRAA
jgi:ornithine cyclodeaminase